MTPFDWPTSNRTAPGMIPGGIPAPGNSPLGKPLRGGQNTVFWRPKGRQNTVTCRPQLLHVPLSGAERSRRVGLPLRIPTFAPAYTYIWPNVRGCTSFWHMPIK